jgi:hypothetical protein
VVARAGASVGSGAARGPDRAVVGGADGDPYALLNLFHATALAGAEGKQLLPDSVLKIRDQADAQKRQKARRLLQDFFAQAADPGGRKA